MIKQLLYKWSRGRNRRKNGAGVEIEEKASVGITVNMQRRMFYGASRTDGEEGYCFI